MKRLDLLALFGLGLLVAVIIASFQDVPGYMDADYYYAGGVRLAGGNGFSEPFLWNYLDDPDGLPHPSHTYWMPLASLVAAAGIWISASDSFPQARLLFLPLAACLAPLTAWLAARLSGRRRSGWIAGGLALFPAFYLSYLTLTETFVLYMLLGTAFLCLAASILDTNHPTGKWRYAALGGLAGLLHLSRADGLIWLAAAALVLLLDKKIDRWRQRILPGICALSGYLLPTLAWYARNLAHYGWPFAPGGSRGLWLTNYDQLYSYPAAILTPAHWLAAGVPALFQHRLDALSLNLQTALAVQGGIFLLPLILAGLWQLRRLPIVQIAMGMWLVTLTVMTLVFPFAGGRGGFFHSGAALQPLLWAVAPAGLDAFIGVGVRLRNWNAPRSTPIFGALLVTVSAILALALFIPAVSPAGAQAASPWRASWDEYARVAQALDALGAAPDQVVMVNNPPGYYAATRRPALVIPDGGIAPLLAAARRYQATYFVLEANHGPDWDALYQAPGDRPGLHYLQSIGKTHLFVIQETP